jgi:hypothetical protein
MAAGDGFEGFGVVFDVVGAKTGVAIVNVHVPVGVGNVAAAALRLRFEVSDATLGWREMNLLGVCQWNPGTGKKEEKRSQE